MKLFLASIGITVPNKLAELIGKPLSEVSCGLIANAMDLKTKERRDQLYQMITDSFNTAGLRFKDIDLNKFIGKTDELHREIENLDLLWLAGGNVFYLRYMMKQSGLDVILKRLIKKGLTYGGDSAGALIVGPTLKTLDLVDDISQVPEVIYEGINLVDFIPLPHWGNQKFQEKLEKIKSDLEKLGYKLTVISDGQAIVVNNDQTEIIGQSAPITS